MQWKSLVDHSSLFHMQIFPNKRMCPRTMEPALNMASCLSSCLLNVEPAALLLTIEVEFKPRLSLLSDSLLGAERREGHEDNTTFYSHIKHYLSQSHLNIDYLTLISEQSLLSPFDSWGRNTDTKNLSLAQGHEAKE